MSRHWPLALLIAASFFLYAHQRVRYVGGSDSYGYYSLAMSLTRGHIALPTELDAGRFPAVAPLAYTVREGQLIPVYPPGFPALLALFSLVGLEFWLSPVLGGLSVLLVHNLLRRRVGPKVALWFAALWALCPLVIWAAINVMSDMASAFFVILCFELIDRRRTASSGVILGLSLAVRATNLLALPAFLLHLRTREAWRRHLSGLIMGALPIAVYNLWIYGAPWRTGYGRFLDLVTVEVFWSHLSFYSSITLVLLTPLVLLGTPLLREGRRESWALALWFLTFLIFYSMWRPGGDVWWMARFLLPAYPALIMLAAVGTERLLARLFADAGETRAVRRFVTTITMSIALVHLVSFSEKEGLFDAKRQNWQRGFKEDSETMAAILPEGSIVGALEYSGAARLYGGIETFRWDHEGAVALIEHALQQRRAVYLILETIYANHPAVERIRRAYELEPVRELELDASLVRLRGR